ncbi:receptor-type tyrosine-protein phosphatase eta-like [Lithobates pipiens]
MVGSSSYNTTTQTNYTFESLTPGTNYTFLVYSVASNKSGQQETRSSYTKPATIKNLKTESATINVISLSWQQPDGIVDHYKIVNSNTSSTITSYSTSAVIDSLTPGSPYSFWIYAVIGSDIEGDGTNIIVYTKPDVVQNLQIINASTTSVTVNWNPPYGYATSYMIQILQNSTFVTNVTSTSVTIQYLTPGNYYTFLVYALTDSLVIGASTSISDYTVPEVVKNLNTQNITTTSISLSWDKPDGNVSSYYIQILEDPTFDKNVTTTSDTITGLTPGNYYTFLVSAVVDGGYVKGTPNVTSDYTIPDVVKNLNTQNITTTSISLSWDKPDGNVSSYYIQILEDPTFDRNVTTTSDTITGLTPGNYYTFLVSAGVDGGNVKGAPNITTDYTIPEVVKNLNTQNITTTSISLSWNKPDGNVSSYYIQILEDPTFDRNVTTTSDTITGLTPGNYYTFLVSAVVDGGNVKGAPNITTDYTIPEVVKNLNTQNITTTSISLSWDKPDGNVSSYYIQILEDPTFDRNVTTTSDTITGLTPGNYYTFLVSAVVDGGNVKGAPNITTDYTIPEVVKNLNTQNITTTSISLSWDKPDGNVSSYYIQILEDPTFDRNVTTTSDTITGLTPGNYYTFLVSAVVDGGKVKGTPNITTDYTIPEVVKNLNTQNITTTSISLSWDKPDGNVSSYYIQILEDPTFDRNVTTTSDTITGLTPGNYYTFLVSAVVDGGNVKGAPNITTDYTIPEVVKNLNTQNITTTSISLSWDKPDGNVSSYYIQILEDPTFDRNVTTTSDTITGLTPGNYYTFLVSAGVDGGNVKGTPNVTNDYPIPEVVKNLNTQNITTTSISLSWDKPDGNVSSYYIQILEDPTFDKNVTTTSDTITGLTPGNYYTFLVSAGVDGGNVKGTPNITTDYTIPEVVKNLNTQNITTTSISLSWDKPDGNVSSYYIQILEDPTFDRNVTTTSDTITGLTPGNYYTFLVSAGVDGGNVKGAPNITTDYTSELSK